MNAGKVRGREGRYDLFFYAVLLIALSCCTLALGGGFNDCNDDTSQGVRCSPDAWGYDTFSARLLAGSVDHAVTSGDRDVGGFMTAFDKSVHIATVELIDGRRAARQTYPYVSNFGLQYTLAKLLPTDRTKPSPLMMSLFSLLCGLAMVLVVAAIAQFAGRRFGRLSGAFVVMIFGLSPLMILHALNPYWMIFLSFLPFVAVLKLYPGASSTRQFCVVAAVAGGFVALKCLTGYEYISTIALGAALPIVYFELEVCEQIDRAVLRRIFVRSVLIGLFALLGFILAAGLHVWKATLLFGNLHKGVMALTVPMSYSSYDTATGIRGNEVLNAAALLSAIVDTLFLRARVVVFPLYAALGATGLILLMRRRSASPEAQQPLDPVDRALLWTFAAATLTSLSWIVLAARHSLVHAHINWITGYMFMYVFAAMILGQNLAALRSGRTNSRATTLAVGATPQRAMAEA